MTDALGMALDDIITQKRSEKRTNRRGRGGKKTGDRAVPYQKPAAALATATDKLVVSNLAQSVSQNDVKELFSRIGPVKSAQLNYNAEGKSKGVATVIFAKSGDASKAYNEYHNRPLDNKPMKIELIINPNSAKIASIAQAQPQRGGLQKKRGGLQKKRGERRPKPADKDAMELDAEMDAYMNETVSFN
ncbi:hypothetical protein HK103_002203 [Boothiomyces macroporosus]|uniref:RRM domain-containing protein n=1 Tax=Boothiomyces macroporosus TaxID=261099 RepID=A0AAD5Y4I4_9FUNG|nr:hypothetical protein HK103_002203 [Boothiomyces macroporosus]